MNLSEWFDSGNEETAFLRRVIDHVSDCLVVVDTQGHIVLINAPYCRLLDGKPEDFIGRHITEVVSPDSRLHKVAQGEPGVMLMPLEVRGHRLLVRQVPVYQDNQIIGAVGLALFSDLATLKKAVVLADGERAIHSAHTPWIAHHGMNDFIGRGSSVETLRAAITQAAQLPWPVLIEGETGTGKEIAANALHAHSTRARRPFVWVNCASIPESLIEAELFGYEGGAFTGARSRGKPGKFEIASGGTLFLDEIGDMPLPLQASLLRVLQSQEVVRVGGVAPISIDTRIICATNRELRSLVETGQFRADLYYRLSVLNIRMPALRERDDLEYLAEQLLDRIARRDGLPSRSLTTDMQAQIKRFDWPGNVRQLEAALMRFFAYGDLGIDAEQQSKRLENISRTKHLTPSPRAALNLHDYIDQQRGDYIRRVIMEADGDKESAARLLGISRATLYRELRRFPAAKRA